MRWAEDPPTCGSRETAAADGRSIAQCCDDATCRRSRASSGSLFHQHSHPGSKTSEKGSVMRDAGRRAKARKPTSKPTSPWKPRSASATLCRTAAWCVICALRMTDADGLGCCSAWSRAARRCAPSPLPLLSCSCTKAQWQSLLLGWSRPPAYRPAARCLQHVASVVAARKSAEHSRPPAVYRSPRFAARGD